MTPSLILFAAADPASVSSQPIGPAPVWTAFVPLIFLILAISATVLASRRLNGFQMVLAIAVSWLVPVFGAASVCLVLLLRGTRSSHANSGNS